MTGALHRKVPTGPGATLSRSVRAEAVLGALILLVAGLLTSLPPARGTYEQVLSAQPLVMTAPAADVRVSLTMAPPRPGRHTFTVRLTGPNGEDVRDARVLLTFSYLDDLLGSNTVVAEPQSSGGYATTGSPVGVEGSWQTEVIVQRPGMDDVRTAFRFRLDLTGAQEETSRAGPALPAIGPTGLGGLGLVVVSVLLLIYVRRSIGLRSLEGAGLGLASLVVAGLGVFVVVRSLPAGPVAAGDPRALRNPILPTQESVAIGERVYRSYGCDTCHGAQGRGDGPAAAGLRPRPADFRVHMAAGHTDGELFNWIGNGVEGTAMPVYRDQLSVEQRWHVINFLKTFAPQ